MEEAPTRRGASDGRTSYLAELRAGELIVIRGRVVRVGGKSLSAHYAMTRCRDGVLAAEMAAVSVQFDPNGRKAIALDPGIRQRLADDGVR